MRILRLIVVVTILSFIAVQLTLAPRAAGPVSEVLIGELLPLTGNFASLGQQYLWAGQTVGEGQMLSIARALMSRPRFLMLDEPSLGIMPRIIDSILDVLQTLHRQEGLTVLLVEQNVPAALAAAERGYVLQTGRIVAEGASRSLLDSDLVRQAYLGM